METLIDVKTLARVKDLPLVAKTVAEGFLYGVQNSTQRGVGMEFSQYRSYEPGDELARIDWKLFARSDRYYVREAQNESETDIFFVLDCTGSMARKSQKGAWDKLHYGKVLAATLAYLGQKQGDNIGLLALSNQSLSFLPAKPGNGHWQRLTFELGQLQSGDYMPDSQLLATHISKFQRPSLIFVISDFYQHQQELVDYLSTFSSTRNEVVALELMCEDEMDFPYQGAVRFKDIETGQERLVSAKQARDDYFNALYEHQSALKKQLADKGVQLHSLNIDKPLDLALYHYLKHRQKAR